MARRAAVGHETVAALKAEEVALKGLLGERQLESLGLAQSAEVVVLAWANWPGCSESWLLRSCIFVACPVVAHLHT